MRTLSLIAALSLAACSGASSDTQAGSPSSAPSSPSEAVTAASSSAASDAPASGPTAREKSATKILGVLKGPDIDPNQRGRIASVGVTEIPVPISSEQTKTLTAVAGEAVDESQKERIFRFGLEDPSSADAVKALCGVDMNGLKAALKAKGKENPDAKTVAGLCSGLAFAPASELGKLLPWAFLFSGVIVEESKRSGGSPDEIAVAQQIRFVGSK